jgi:uncharacterized protein
MGIEPTVPRHLAHQRNEIECDCTHSTEILSAWLHINGGCNLHCDYCYVQKDDRRMDNATGLAAVDAVFNSAMRNEFVQVQLKYAGGEPLLNFPLVQTLQIHAMHLSEQTGIGLRSMLLTNGIALSPLVLKSLKELSISLSISVDGEWAHNLQRRTKRGQGSHPMVVRGVNAALRVGLRPHLLLTVTKHNVEHLAEFANFAFDRDLSFSFNLMRSSQNGDESLRATDDQIVAGLRKAFFIVEQRKGKQAVDGLVDLLHFQPHEYACAAGRSYVVIDPDGKLAFCQMALDQTLGDVYSGDLLDQLRSPTEGFPNRSVSERTKCKDCAYKEICAGGCPVMAMKGMPFCEVYKQIIPDLVRLDGFRLDAERVRDFREIVPISD